MNTSDYIMITIVAIFLLAVIIGGISHESMTPEEKKKWEEEEQLRKYNRQLNRKIFWHDFLHSKECGPGITD